MGKATIHTADVFTAGLLKKSFETLRVTDCATTTFTAGDVEFQLVIKRINGQRIMSKAERELAKRIKQGQQDLNPSETRIARRILAKQKP